MIDVTQPKEGYRVALNRYWLCTEGDLTRAIFFGNSPQCNTKESISRMGIVLAKDGTGWPVDVVFAPISYIPLNLNYD